LVGTLAPAKAAAIEDVVKRVSTTAMLIVVVLVAIVGLPAIVKMGVVPILCILAFAACAIVIGHLMGGPPERYRPVLATALAMRWPAPALVLAKENGWTQQILPVVLTYLIGGAVLTAIYGKWLNRVSPNMDVEDSDIEPQSGQQAAAA